MNQFLKYAGAILGSVLAVVLIVALVRAFFAIEPKAPAAVAERPAPAAPPAPQANLPPPAAPPVAAPPAPPAAAQAPAAQAPAAQAPAAVAPAAVAPAAGAPGAGAAGAADIATRLAAADPAAATPVRVRCAACHTFEQSGPNRVGPNLWNVVGRDKASVPGFQYSEAMKNAPGTWTFGELDAFLTNPMQQVPGTRMNFPGLPDAKDRANIIAYLRTLSTNPVPLP